MRKLIGKPKEWAIELPCLPYFMNPPTRDISTIAMYFMDHIPKDYLWNSNSTTHYAFFCITPDNRMFVVFRYDTVIGIFVNGETLKLQYQHSLLKNFGELETKGLTARMSVSLGKVLNFFNNLPTKKSRWSWRFKKEHSAIYFPKPYTNEDSRVKPYFNRDSIYIVRFIPWEVSDD